MMNTYFAKLDMTLDTSDVFTDPAALRCNGEYLRQQKYGVALLRKKSFTSVPNRSYVAADKDAERLIAQLPQRLLNIEVPKVWVLDMQAPVQEPEVMLAHMWMAYALRPSTSTATQMESAPAFIRMQQAARFRRSVVLWPRMAIFG